jgi:hypothetical protein
LIEERVHDSATVYESLAALGGSGHARQS